MNNANDGWPKSADQDLIAEDYDNSLANVGDIDDFLIDPKKSEVVCTLLGEGEVRVLAECRNGLSATLMVNLLRLARDVWLESEHVGPNSKQPPRITYQED